MDPIKRPKLTVHSRLPDTSMAGVVRAELWANVKAPRRLRLKPPKPIDAKTGVALVIDRILARNGWTWRMLRDKRRSCPVASIRRAVVFRAVMESHEYAICNWTPGHIARTVGMSRWAALQGVERVNGFEQAGKLSTETDSNVGDLP